ncbi:MAG: helix-turn-helix transcriptional regulator [Microcella sp.]|uniref:helix-turn-helix domain-containing protein n=1 Tax=Microcella sp. TaxID=1913979 RepID=UPI0027190BDB|nr:helix-turn-helix transcriptional regulator [Microcella sp.]MDO8338441.1 helix-turn-helix transcriptional regulator [Microcella sp.]
MIDASPTPSAADQRFAAEVKKVRERRSMSQELVAELMRERGFRFHQATIYKIENGSRRVTVGEAEALSQVLGASLSFLIASGSEDVYADHVVKLAVRLVEQHEELATVIDEILLLESSLVEARRKVSDDRAASDELYPDLDVDGVIAAVSGLPVEDVVADLRRRRQSPGYSAIARSHGFMD